MSNAKKLLIVALIFSASNLYGAKWWPWLRSNTRDKTPYVAPYIPHVETEAEKPKPQPKQKVKEELPEMFII